MDWNKPPTLKQFVDTFQSYLADIGIKGPEGYIAAHKIEGHIHVYSNDPDDNDDYEITGLDFDQLWGCGCASGITIKIRRVKND